MNFSIVGLFIITLGWILQLVSKEPKLIKPTFVGFYALGVLLLVIDGYLAGLYNLAILNFATLILSALVFLRTRK